MTFRFPMEILRHLARLRPRVHTPGRQRTLEQADASLFRGLRLRLTVWYSTVLALALLACGLVVYLVLQDVTLKPVRESLTGIARLVASEWERVPSRACGSRLLLPRPIGPARPLPVYVACFTADGSELTRSFRGAEPPAAFLEGPLVGAALASGAASDIVDGGEGVGEILRVASVVRDPRSGAAIGVVQAGQSVAVQLDTLQLLRNVLLLVAGAAVAMSAFVGLVLAERALEPARVAFTRQQAFIADASHQLRTPLTLLRADSEVLLRGSRMSPEDRELLEDIVAEVAHMDALTTSLLALARLDAGQRHLEVEGVDLAELARDVAGRFRSLAAQRELTLRQQLQPASLPGDRHLLEQAALILMDNAVKYTPAGGTVTLSTETRDGLARLTVADTGIGIAPDDVRRVGERFYRVDPARSHKGGAGLGLAIARGIAAAHGGSLEIASKPGRGTSATISLPSSRPSER